MYINIIRLKNISHLIFGMVLVIILKNYIIMKNIIYLLIMFIGLSSCVTNYYTMYDDVYYSKPKTSNETEYTTVDSSVIIMNDITYYEEDFFVVEIDYTSRIRRFHNTSLVYLPYYHPYWCGNYYYYGNYYDQVYYYPYYYSTYYPIYYNYNYYTFNHYNYHPYYNSPSRGVNSYYGRREHMSFGQKQYGADKKTKTYTKPSAVASRPATPQRATTTPRTTVPQRPTASSRPATPQRATTSSRPATPQRATTTPRTTAPQRPTASSRPATPQPKTYSRPQSGGHATYRRN